MSSNSDDEYRYEKCSDGCDKPLTDDNWCRTSKWRYGPIEYYDKDIQEWHRAGETDIVLKIIEILNDKNNIPDEFFEEIKTQMTSFVEFGFIIRCFGVAVGFKPYYNIPHDDALAFLITCKKIHPDIDEDNTPKIIVDLIKRCWSEDPDNRPTAIELLDELFSCRQKDHEIWTEIKSIEANKNFDIPLEEASLDYITSEKAIYTSQLITISQELVSNTSKRISVSSVPDS
ncbi:9407_t:CDS:2 [Cetraspora pellucida]|uniref:9407_t:CDS:1 n=1 Tax=Cetraspora pellucida TaxID=1433469 RepID=A0A9N9ESM9_9GLOM|nr:9407_t:CDS:2 [Cetraspora pellucida]